MVLVSCLRTCSGNSCVRAPPLFLFHLPVCHLYVPGSRDPFVIEALEQLAELGVHPDTLTDICGQTDLQWLPKWLQAKFEENRCHYQGTVNSA